jgi:phosphoglucosamine mutase
VIALGVDPDGENINRQCGSLHPQNVARMVKEQGAHIGISLDGDADRAIFSDEKGNVVDGDQIMAICARDLHGANRLKKGTVVATVMSNLGLDVALGGMGNPGRADQVGDRYVVEENGPVTTITWGGEQSGHLIFLDYNTTGDGVLSALQVLAVMKREEKIQSLPSQQENSNGSPSPVLRSLARRRPRGHWLLRAWPSW